MNAAAPSTRVVVGIDGSWPARAALQWAARYARATDAVLHAVRVLEWPIGFGSASTPQPGPTLRVPDSELDESYRNGMRRVFDEVDPLPGWELTFAEGAKALMLVQLAEAASLLVLGSRERDVPGDARVGDIGHYCISHSRRPVVVVPVEYLDDLDAPSSTFSSGGRGNGHGSGPRSLAVDPPVREPEQDTRGEER